MKVRDLIETLKTMNPEKPLQCRHVKFAHCGSTKIESVFQITVVDRNGELLLSDSEDLTDENQ